jgi:hypothetical protein
MQHIILRIMILFLAFPLFAENPSPTVVKDEKKFIQYLAGIELLDHSKTLGENKLAEKYKNLCLITGLNADSAEARIMRLKDKPEEWRKVRTKVLELLQTLQ